MIILPQDLSSLKLSSLFLRVVFPSQADLEGFSSHGHVPLLSYVTDPLIKYHTNLMIKNIENTRCVPSDIKFTR